MTVVVRVADVVDVAIEWCMDRLTTLPAADNSLELRLERSKLSTCVLDAGLLLIEVLTTVNII